MLFSNGWFCITTQLFIKISFRPRTAGWYVVTNGKIFVWVFFLCWRANLLSSKRTPVRDLSMKLLGYPRALRHSLKFERHSSYVVCEGFVRRSLVASPLINLVLHPEGGRRWNACIGKFQILPTRFGKFKILLARFGKLKILPARFGKFKILRQDLENSRSCNSPLANSLQ